MNLLKEGRSEYSSTFEGKNKGDMITFWLKFDKKEPKGFSTHRESPYQLNGYYNSPSHFGSSAANRGSSLSSKNHGYNPEKKYNFGTSEYQGGDHSAKALQLQIPTLRRVES